LSAEGQCRHHTHRDAQAGPFGFRNSGSALFKPIRSSRLSAHTQELELLFYSSLTAKQEDAMEAARVMPNGMLYAAALIEDLRAGGRGSALNFARQLPNALSGIPQASQYLR
jgi:hypothetical protein